MRLVTCEVVRVILLVSVYILCLFCGFIVAETGWGGALRSAHMTHILYEAREYRFCT